jgi:branched-chain amino acid transport system ATP-binding protein
MKDDREKTLYILHDEHRAISAVLSGMRELARLARDPAVRPEFNVLHAMLYYIDAFPEQLHHPKEEEYLFMPLVARAPHATALVEELRSQHLTGVRLARELQRALIAFEIEWPKGAAGFADAVKRYADFHWDHMRREEKELLPLAERYLSADDWRCAQRAFAANDNPIDERSEKDFARLFTRIVNLAPAPVGLGTPWRKISA